MVNRLGLLLLLFACGECSYSTRVSGPARPLGVVQVDEMAVGFSVQVVNDHLGMAPTGAGGGPITGFQFPEDQWWPRIHIDVVGPQGPVEVREARARDWYQVGPPAESEGDARVLADALTLESCIGPNVIIYRYQHGSFQTPWAAVYAREAYAQHSDAAGANEATCEAALLLQPGFADAVMGHAAPSGVPTPHESPCDALLSAGLTQEAMACALSRDDAGEAIMEQLRPALRSDPSLQQTLFTCLTSDHALSCSAYAEELADKDQRDAFVRHQLGVLQRGGLECVRGAALAASINSLNNDVLCRQALDAAERAAHSTAPPYVRRMAVQRAGELALGLECAPERVEAVVVSIIPGQGASWPSDQSESADCPALRDAQTCRSLVRRAGILAARTCEPDHVAASRAFLLQSPIMFRTGDIFAREPDQDAALRVMAACAPAEATNMLRGVSGALPSSYELAP
jgi:hypothetical protein